jgi:hypothetical protein
MHHQTTRLKETSSLSTDSTLVASTPKSQSLASNSHVEVTNPFSTAKTNGDLPTNSIDYDFNINAIKTLLMTTKVPESCV